MYGVAVNFAATTRGRRVDHNRAGVGTAVTNCSNLPVGRVLRPACPSSSWAWLSEKFPDMVVRQEVGLACPSRWSCLSTPRTAQFEHLSDGHVRELLGQAGPRTRWIGKSEQSVSAVGALGGGGAA
ncbi:hypothetical protein PSTG_08708 [Puccinia striiformis f. sp. tritici PST-78]|uniref:Uncharacterized protein n=1 Tax=Puccinia striiformis f. sp. tritici PST-78 TaxID=1165861 RepID=A0A0L0VFH3_9BASI|nr:hypothetical protein PSTG_08708 [Puccinia striiformis f. sp. tritici PST-78]